MQKVAPFNHYTKHTLNTEASELHSTKRFSAHTYTNNGLPRQRQAIDYPLGHPIGATKRVIEIAKGIRACDGMRDSDIK